MQTAASHKFAFGKNWKNFSRGLSDEKIAMADENLSRLLAGDGLQGKSFLDIGSGSGLHALAAIRHGAAKIVAFDVDPHSVETTRSVIARYAPGHPAQIEQNNILDAPPANHPVYDVVYSWGVLHHTGDMWRAVKNAADFVAPGGRFIIALYKKSPSCGFWRVEKSIYSRLPALLQFPVTALYCALYLMALALSGKNPVKYVREYADFRGMDFWHDAIDWLGGYPYESASPAEVEAFFAGQGFTLEHAFNTAPPRAVGLFGIGCAEYIFRKR